MAYFERRGRCLRRWDGEDEIDRWDVCTAVQVQSADCVFLPAKVFVFFLSLTLFFLSVCSSVSLVTHVVDVYTARTEDRWMDVHVS